MEPFRIAVPDHDLADLHERLARTRFPGEVRGSGWTYGTELGYLQELVAHWRDHYDWRAHEARLNLLPQFRTRANGFDVHFVHVRGQRRGGPAPLPLVLTNGWPSSFAEFEKVIGPLTDPGAHGGDPADAFDVVVPSLIGYGFSEIPTVGGVTPSVMADAWADLMGQLGYDRFCAHGSDWGALVTTMLGRNHAPRLHGLHLTMVALEPGGDAAARTDDVERKAGEQRKQWLADEGGYQAIQGSRPQTLAYGLTDSPAGLAGWIIEKFRAWSDCGGDVERAFTRDELLTNVAIYWFTGTILSSTRLYYENRARPVTLRQGERIEVPSAFAIFPADMSRVRSRAERAYDVTRWTEFPRGGHFPALETPELLVDDLRATFRAFR